MKSSLHARAEFESLAQEKSRRSPMAKENVQAIVDGAETPEVQDVEKTQPPAMEPMSDVEILERSWSKRALIVAFIG